LEKAKPNKNTKESFKKSNGINIENHLFDYTDLIKAINNLETNRLIELNDRYFKNKSEKYTNEIVLNLVFKNLILNSKKINKNYDDDFGNIDTQQKISLNKLNTRVTNKINSGLDYISIIDDNDEDNLLEDLRELVINNMYKNKLLEELSFKISTSELSKKDLEELHELAIKNSIDFNKVISNLHKDLDEKIDISDYNSMSISWIIISFFFEICDIGIKK
jgi:hypothetical protein